jgi:hypothetical protein
MIGCVPDQRFFTEGVPCAGLGQAFNGYDAFAGSQRILCKDATVSQNAVFVKAFVGRLAMTMMELIVERIRKATNEPAGTACTLTRS